MTRERLEAYVAAWLPRLRLTHWDIFIDWEEQPEGDASAVSIWAEAYDTVILRFAGGYAQWSPRYAETVVVHELIHLVTRDLDVAAAASHSLLRGAALNLAEARYNHEVEGVVDRLASAFVALAPFEDV